MGGKAEIAAKMKGNPIGSICSERKVHLHKCTSRTKLSLNGGQRNQFGKNQDPVMNIGESTAIFPGN